MEAAAQTVRADPGAPRQALHSASSASHAWIARDDTAVAIRPIRQADLTAFHLELDFVAVRRDQSFHGWTQALPSRA